MSKYGLLHSVAVYEVGNTKDLVDALCYLSDLDCDFNGENGVDYICEDAKENGFKSNQSYYSSIVLRELNNGLDECVVIEKFLKAWLDHDNYYAEWKHDVVIKGNIAIISLAALTYC